MPEPTESPWVRYMGDPVYRAVATGEHMMAPPYLRDIFRQLAMAACQARDAQRDPDPIRQACVKCGNPDPTHTNCRASDTPTPSRPEGETPKCPCCGSSETGLTTGNAVGNTHDCHACYTDFTPTPAPASGEEDEVIVKALVIAAKRWERSKDYGAGEKLEAFERRVVDRLARLTRELAEAREAAKAWEGFFDAEHALYVAACGDRDAARAEPEPRGLAARLKRDWLAAVDEAFERSTGASGVPGMEDVTVWRTSPDEFYERLKEAIARRAFGGLAAAKGETP